MDYVKSLVLQLPQMDEKNHADLFPALATCLQLNEDEVGRVARAHAARTRGGGRRLLDSLNVFRQGGAEGSEWPQSRVDLEQSQQALLKELEARALADGVAFGALLNQVRELEAGEALTKLEASALRAEVASLKQQQQQQQRRAEPAAAGAVTSARGDADWLYLRNVILKYMETEDHHSMFPVVATLLHLTASEVTTVARAREERASQRVSKGWFG
jgi:hypothetical protein